MRKVSSQNLVKVICVNFHQNRPNGVAIKRCDGQTYRHTDTQTGLIPDVNIFSYEMTEYKNAAKVKTAVNAHPRALNQISVNKRSSK